jgi:hypothetical protein
MGVVVCEVSSHEAVVEFDFGWTSNDVEIVSLARAKFNPRDARIGTKVE